MKVKLLIVLALILLSGIFEVVKTEIRYVSKTGSSTPPYTSWQTAADSIQKCINSCNDGDTVIVANGVYKEALAIYNVLTLLGSSIDSTIIDGTGLNGIDGGFGGEGITVRVKNICRMENFHIKGKAIEPLTTVISAWEKIFYAKNLKIENAYSGIGISFGGEIKNCYFINLSGCIGTGSMFNQDTIKIFNNVLINNQDNGMGIGNAGGGIHYIYNNIILGQYHLLFSGIDLSLDNYSEIKNNLVANYRFQNFDGSVFLDKTIIENNAFLQNNNNYADNDNLVILKGNNTIVRNNIITHTGRYGIHSENDTAFADYNLFWKNESNTNRLVKLGEHNIYANPMFVKDTIPTGDMTFDFHLQKYSPAIDAGDPSILDKDGSRSDIGMYGGPYGESYTYQDLAPKPPANLTARIDSNIIFLKWLKSTETDFGYYKVYRDTVPDFIYDSTKAISKAADTLFAEAIPGKGKTYYYKVTAFDKTNHQSPASEEVSVVITNVDKPRLVANDYMLYQNYPNPFNPSTTISYRLKERGKVILSVYDIQGKMVTQLKNTVQESGYYEVEFSPDKIHNKTASGLYVFYFSVTDLKGKPVYSSMKKSIYLK